VKREFFSRADKNIISGCCVAPMDSWIEGREHHVICSVCREYSVFKKVRGIVVCEKRSIRPEHLRLAI
jgi:hypothetical protein